MRWAGLTLVFLLCACGTAPPLLGNASAARSIQPSAAPPTSPSPLSASRLSCRLPITVPGGQTRSGGFVNLPAGTFTPDPSSLAVNSILQPGREFVDQTYALYFDRAFSRWLPVNRKAVSPDGTHYAFTDRPIGTAWSPTTRITLHVVEVRTDRQVTFDAGDGSDPLIVLDYAANGIYLTTFGYHGLWLVNPRNGDTNRLAELSLVQGSAGDGFFWVGAVNPNDPHPIAGAAADELDLLNLADGTRVPWLYLPGTSVHFVAQDVNRHPVVITSTVEINSVQLLYLPGPGISRTIPQTNDLPNISDPLSDLHGVWFGASDGIYLYSEAGALRKVSSQPGLPANGCA
jgi:hypothetical protein